MFYPQLDIVPVIAKAKSFSKAAHLLNLSQPAISGKVQAIENHYSTKIFQRTTHGVTLTEEGKIVCSYAQKITDMYQAMDEALNKLTNIDKLHITIGSSCTSGNYAMPCTIRAFKNEYPHVDIKLDITNTEQSLTKLANKQIDIAVVDGKVNNPNFKVFYLDSLELVFVTSKYSRIKKSEVTFNELLNMPFVIREKGAAMRTVIENLLSDKGCQVCDCNIVSEMNSIQSLKSAVEGGLGVSLVPLIAVQNELNSKNLREIKVTGMDLKVDVNLVSRTEDEPTKIVQKFTRFLTNKNGFCWSLKPAI